MRLRHFHVQGLPPLSDIALSFGQEKILKRKLAIHFIVGVNGTGKTRLLQALTEVFLALAQEVRPLPFPVTLAYDLGVEKPRTIFLYYPGGAHSKTSLIEFSEVLPEDVEWSALENYSWDKEGDPPYPVQNRFLE